MIPDESHAAVFEEHRGLLTGVAYRMLGSVSDAEDMVQETWLRWTGVDPSGIDVPRRWLLTVISRLCLDRLKSARVQREQYYGTWLPEPLLDHSAASMAEVDESVSMALLLVLEKLSPVERAGFLLHDVFGHTFEEVAQVLGKEPAACRKLVSRARERVRAERPRFAATGREHEELLRRFLDACRQGEIEPLRDLLSESAALYSDGGGRVSAIPTVLTDRNVIATFFVNIHRKHLHTDDSFEMRFQTLNGVPGVLFYQGGRLATALTLDVREGRIAAIFAQRNPDKLRALEEEVEREQLG